MIKVKVSVFLFKVVQCYSRLFCALLQKCEDVLCTFTKVYGYYIMSCALENGVIQNGGSVPFLKERSFREVQKGGKSKKAKSKKAKSKKAKSKRK